MWQRKAAARQQEAEDRSLARKLADQATDPCEKLRYLCLARGSAGILGLGRVFRRMDDDGSRALSYEEFVKGITESGLKLSDEQSKILFSRFDRDGNGSVDVTEFLFAVRPPMSPMRVKLLKEAFQKIDKTGDGEVTAEDLKNVYSVKMHPRYLSGEETEEQILKQFLAVFEQDGNVDGKKNNFIMWQQEAAQHQQESADKSLARQHADHATDPCDKLRYLCLERGPTGMLEFGRVFRRMDNFGSEVLSFEEFVKGIASSGLNLSDEEIEALFSQFGRDSDGSIDVTEFLIAVRPPMSPTRVRILKEAFHKLDKTGSGEITVADLRKLYSVKMHPRYLNGDDSEEKILKQFLAVFEQDGHVDGNITEEDFMNYYAGISTSIDHDIYFDLMIRKAFSL